MLPIVITLNKLIFGVSCYNRWIIIINTKYEKDVNYGLVSLFNYVIELC